MAFVLTTVQASDFNNTLQVGAKLYLYAADGVTLQAGYQDKAGSTAHSNPVVCSASGQESVWLDDTLTYRLILRDAADANTYFDQVIDPATHPTGLHIYPQAQGDQSVKTTDTVRFGLVRVSSIPTDADDDRAAPAEFVVSKTGAAQAAAIAAAAADATQKADAAESASSALANAAQAKANTADEKAGSALQQIADLGGSVLAGSAPIDNGDLSGTDDAVDLGTLS